MILVSVAAALAPAAARAAVLPDDYDALLAGDSITVTAPDPSFVPGMDPYDAHWLARLLHGQAYLVRFSEYGSVPRHAWLIIAPTVIPRLGGRSGPPLWCGTGFTFIDATTSVLLLIVAIGQRPASKVADCRR